MKLKQRLMALLGVLSLGLLCTMVVNVVSYERLLFSKRDRHMPAINPELTVDKQDGDPLAGVVGLDGGAPGANVDASESQAGRLASVLRDLRRPEVAQEAVKSGNNLVAQNNAPSYHDIVRRLLQDRSFNSDETISGFIELGKTLELYVKPPSGDNKDPAAGSDKETSDENRPLLPKESEKSPVKPEQYGDKMDGHNDKNRIHDDDKISNNSPNNHGNLPEPYPTFNLSFTVVRKLQGCLRSKRQDFLTAKNRNRKPLSLHAHKASSKTSWQLWQNTINQFSLYDNSHGQVDNLLHDLANSPVAGLTTMTDYGTQIKVLFKLQDGSQALFKPMRIKRDQDRDPNLFYFDDFERHHAEIGAFHLDRIMEFNRVPPNSGRFVNITLDIERFATKSFKRTIYISPGGNKCFYGKCDYYCDSGHPVCGTPGRVDLVEGAMAAWLPFGKGTGKKSWENPWRRSYSKFRKADWETDDLYCDTVKITPPYDSGRRLLDLLDITIFDYLTGNQDRHHYHTFKAFGNYTSPLLYDNGRGFGFIMHDESSILVPLVQCCRIRYSTLEKLLHFETDHVKLSGYMRKSLSKDPLSSGPNGLVLGEGHLKALDRRVSKILDAVHTCVQNNGFENVIIADGF